MKSKNTDVALSYSQMLDTITNLFKGSLNIPALLELSVPFTRSLVEGRLSNIKQQRALAEKEGRQYIDDRIDISNLFG